MFFILAEITPSLDLDEFQQDLAGILRRWTELIGMYMELFS
jgi:hypothetical protein